MLVWAFAPSAVLAAWVVAQFTVLKPGEVAPVRCEALPGLCGAQVLEGSAPLPDQQGGFAYGRWKVPSNDLARLDAHRSGAEHMFTLKRWSYLSITTPEYFISLIPVHFNYIEDLTFSIVSRKEGKSVFNYKWQMPLGSSLEIASESMNGCTTYRNKWIGNDNLSLCFDKEQNAWILDVNVREVSCQITIHKGDEALALWYPLGADKARPGYIHKEAGMSAEGTVRLNAESKEPVVHKFGKAQGAAALDWTKSYALRETRWNWVSFSTPSTPVKLNGGAAKDRAFGINLSLNVYDTRTSGSDEMFGSSENAIWVDHKVYPLNLPIDLKMPQGGALSGAWAIHASKKGHAEISLEFSPNGLHEDHTGHRALGIVSDFVQPHGTFKGTVRVKSAQGDWFEVQVNGAYGVCEDHHAIW